MSNFLFLGPLLINHLNEQLGVAGAAAQLPRIHVLGSADLSDVAIEQQLTPAVHIVYQGYRKVEGRSDGKAARIVQTWLAVAAARNVRDLRAGSAARNDAGVIADLVLDCLMGWEAPKLAKPLELVSGPAAGYGGGFQYLPLAFEAEFVRLRP